MKPKHIKYTPGSINGSISTVCFGLVLDSDHTANIAVLWTSMYNLEDHSSYLRQSEIHSMDSPHTILVLMKVASKTDQLYTLFLFTHTTRALVLLFKTMYFILQN